MSGQNSTTKPPVTEARREAARRNGAKSRGAVTPQGQARAAAANLRHGLFARTLLLPGENPATFADYLQSLYAEYLPADPSEKALVDEIAEASWQRRRIAAMFTAVLRDNVIRHSAETDDTDAAGCNGHAWQDLADNSRSLDTFIRYEQILVRRIQTARNSLADLRSGKRDFRSRFRVHPGPLGPSDGSPTRDPDPVEDSGPAAPISEPAPDQLADDAQAAEASNPNGHFENGRFDAQRRFFVNRSQAGIENKQKPLGAQHPPPSQILVAAHG